MFVCCELGLRVVTIVYWILVYCCDCFDKVWLMVCIVALVGFCYLVWFAFFVVGVVWERVVFVLLIICGF